MKWTHKLVAAVALAAGIAGACELKPMPWVGVIKLDWTDMLIAKFSGFRNPMHAAIMQELDERAEKAVGEANWKANEFMGPIMYQVGNDAITVTFDKPCGETAESTSEKQGGIVDSGGGGGGGGGYDGGDYAGGGGGGFDGGGYIPIIGCAGTMGEMNCQVFYIPAT